MVRHMEEYQRKCERRVERNCTMAGILVILQEDGGHGGQDKVCFLRRWEDAVVCRVECSLREDED